MPRPPAPHGHAPAEHARAGDLDALVALHVEHGAAEAYKWLLVALDHGHAEAADRLDDLCEHHDALRYDDDGHAIMFVHLELATAYLLGLEGLPRDEPLATAHLEAFLDGPHESLEAARTEFLDPLREACDAPARAVLDRCMAEQPFRAVTRRVERLRHLARLDREGAQIPRVVLDAELERLHHEVASLTADLRQPRRKPT